MKRIRKFLKRFRNEDGQSTTEYILILAVAVMIAMKFKNSIGTKIGDITDNLGNQINQSITNSGG